MKTTKEINNLKRAVVELFNRQTEGEKQGRKTEQKNKMGFNAHDAKILTSIAFQVLKKQPLTEAQVEVLKDRLPKYNGQLKAAKIPEIPESGMTR